MDRNKFVLSHLIVFTFEKTKGISGKGPVGKFFSEASLKEIMQTCNAEIGDSIFMACGQKTDVEKILSLSRNKIADELNLIKKDSRRYAKRQSTWFRNSFSYDIIYNKIYTGDSKFTNKAVKALNLLYT